MIAYNATALDNRHIQGQAEEAMAAGCITGAEAASIRAAYPIAFYTPNIYIRVGLFILTIVIAAFSVGLLALLSGGNERTIGALMIFSGLLSYGILEYLVYDKRYFRSGVDDALLWLGAGLIFAGIMVSSDNISALSLCTIAFALAVLGSLRFADRVLMIVAYVALAGIVFNTAIGFGNAGKASLPFLLMGLSLMICFISARCSTSHAYRHYHSCLTLLKAAALAGFYLAGNYFVVREFSDNMFLPYPRASGGLAFGWLFWVLTIATPVFYIYYGLKKKNIVPLWVGLGLVAATVYTVRSYYHILPLEWAMTLAGIGLSAIAYACIRYLKVPRFGFTVEAAAGKNPVEALHIESILVAEIAASAVDPAADPGGVRFGGGSGGGGGASGEY